MPPERLSDRLLVRLIMASGGRFWLDVARYSDDRLNSTKDDPYSKQLRYRDWVVAAFNDDMP